MDLKSAFGGVRLSCLLRPPLCKAIFRDVQSRINWIKDVRTALEADRIGWTMWDYRSGFRVGSWDRRSDTFMTGRIEA
jgi:hypothetical protein